MRAHEMFRLCFVIFLGLALSNLSEARQQRKHVAAVLVGSVYCDACSQQSFSKASHFISGAVVAVKCSGTKTAPKFTKEVSTNEHGKFKVHLPFSVSKHVKKLNRCSVKLIKSSEPSCAVASASATSALHSKSIKEGNHIFSAGFLTFKPLKQPEVCDQKRNVQESKEFKSQKSITNHNDPRYLPPLENPPTSNSNLPLPQVPILSPLLPLIPNLPPLLGTPIIPAWPKKASTNKGTTKSSELSDEKVAQPQFFGPNNPFRPPSLFPPIFPSPPTSTIPSPPTSIFPPLIPSPSTSTPSLYPYPPGNLQPAVPGLSPSPLLPTPPASRFPLPLFRPVPGFPGGNLQPAVPGLSPSPLLPTPPASRFPLPLFRPVPGFPGFPPAVKSISSKNSEP